MGDISVWTLLTTLLINVIVFTICFLVWTCIKNKRSKDLDSAYFKDTELPMIEEHKMGSCEIWSAVNKATDKEIVDARSTEALIYLSLHKRLIYAFAILCVLGCGILIPLYV